MKIAVLKETMPGERRVALVPESAKRLVAKGFEVLAETGGGGGASFPDQDYRDAGAAIGPSGESVLGGADLILKIHPPTPQEVELLRPGALLVGLLYPRQNAGLVKLLAARKVTALALDLMPRTTLAQTMDVLSSQ